jgi:hypothetical protein
MTGIWGELPALPEIGFPESFYAKEVARADKAGNRHAHAAFKVGQYITLGMGMRLTWDQKRKYFSHAIRAHCTGPAMSSADVLKFYARLADMVRRHAGNEAIRLASREDDAWAAQLQRGVPRHEVFADAERFFRHLVGDCSGIPDYFNAEDWEQLVILRNQWMLQR